jgi:mono/diheme cytochrome c family protein
VEIGSTREGKLMKNALAAITFGLAIASTAAASDHEPAAGSGGGTVVGSRVERGRYLVSIIGCSDCHTPLKMGPKGPGPDMERFLSGHPEQIGAVPAATPHGPWLWAGVATNTAVAGPWGVSYAANLTPDDNTGLGIWSEQMFLDAIRTGRHMGVAREIKPPMPWPALRNASNEDLRAIYAYLRTLKPIANHVPDAQEPAAVIAAKGT